MFELIFIEFDKFERYQNVSDDIHCLLSKQTLQVCAEILPSIIFI